MTQDSPVSHRPAPDPLLASHVPGKPPVLTDSIKLQSKDRLENALRQIRRSLPDPIKNDQTITQSNGAHSAASALGAFTPIIEELLALYYRRLRRYTRGPNDAYSKARRHQP